MSYIGRATCVELARIGTRVVVADNDRQRADEVVAAILDEGNLATSITLDVSDSSQVAEAIARIHEQLGRIDVLVNAAGIGRFTPTLDVSDQEWHEVLNVNLTGTFLMCRAVGRIMTAQGSGRIVNVGSLAGLLGSPGMAPYTASKHGVVGLTKALAVEWATYGVRVNCLCPGATETPLVTSVFTSATYVSDTARRIPLGRLAQPVDQAKAILFLCSSDAGHITGAVLNVDGGVSAMSPTAPASPPPPSSAS